MFSLLFKPCATAVFVLSVFKADQLIEFLHTRIQSERPVHKHSSYHFPWRTNKLDQKRANQGDTTEHNSYIQLGRVCIFLSYCVKV
jgi:hypothetical protein